MNFVNTHEIIWIYRYEYKWINMYINEWNMLKRTKLIKSGLLHWHVCSQLAGSVEAVEVELCGSHQNCAKCHGRESTWNGWAEKYTAKVLRWPQGLTKSYETLLKRCWKDVEKMLKRCWKDWLGMGLIRVIRTIRALLSCSFGRTLCSPSGWSQEMYLQLHNPDRSSNRKKLPLSTLATLKYSQYNRTNLPFVRQESPSVLHQAPGRAQKHKQGAVRWSVMQWFLDNSQISCICIYIIILYIYKYIILHILNILYITYIILYL
jgi:hypothetical protein